ncbi:tyrosine-type recombinase/integrase [Anaerostipes hadrus]|uniref:tyrosine-type recombinase/integrase n=1 Tax=Anaerostipes hadrus TaxID=649756 RepID=UPI001897DAC6|nr:tyrosine-type recombinase/integrase [Anaerostipes hadrus]
MLSSFLIKPSPLTFYAYKKIMDQNPPKAFSDFLDIGYRTGLRSKFLCNLKKENVDLNKKVITGNDPKTSLPIYVVLDDGSFSILERRIKNTKSEYIFSDNNGNPYSLSYYRTCFMKTLESEPLNFNLREEHMNLHSIRAGNREMLKEFHVPIFEITFRQNTDLYGSSHVAYVTDQTKSVDAINKFFPMMHDIINQRELNGYYD